MRIYPLKPVMENKLTLSRLYVRVNHSVAHFSKESRVFWFYSIYNIANIVVYFCYCDTRAFHIAVCATRS